MRYPNLNALPDVLSYIFSKILLVLGNLPRLTTRFRQIYKKLYIFYFLKKLAVTRVVARSSHGNALHYDLIMFLDFENLLYLNVA